MADRRARVPALMLGALLLAGCMLAGCAAQPLPDVEVSVYQPRTDVSAGRIAIQVHNTGTEPLTVTGVRLESSYFTEPLVWTGERAPVIAAGFAVDLRVPVSASTCERDARPRQTVVLDYRTDGGAGTLELVPADPHELLPRLRDTACLESAVAEVAALVPLKVATDHTPGAPGELVIEVRHAGGEGTVTVESVFSTTLIAPASGGIGVAELPLGLELGSNGPLSFSIPIVPNRCDAHALAEDKVGTRLPVGVSTSGGASGRLALPASDDVRGQLYAFFASYCRL